MAVCLTDEQQAIVAHDHGPALVFAVAGAGKTTALVHRVERLVRQRVFDPRRILLTSFSRMAVADLKRALSAWPHCDAVRTSTLHALGLWVVRRAAKEGLVVLKDEPLGEGQERALLAKTLRRARELRVDYADELETLDLEDFLSYVGACKGNLHYADLEAAALPPSARQVARQAQAPAGLEWYLDLYRLYEQVRQEEGALTYDDLLLVGWELLVRHEGLAQAMAKGFQAVLVDEFQDVNLAQSEILDLLTPERNYMVVGDDDQTIYEWRGASPRFILEFERRYGAKKYLIRDSFRCSAAQVALAGRLIAHNRQREPKRLSLTRGFEGQVFVHNPQSIPDQAREIVGEIAEALRRGMRLGDIAILVRLYAQTPYIEQALIEAQIPYRVVGSPPFYRRPEIETLLAYLELGRLELTPNPDPGRLAQAWGLAYNRPTRYLSRTLAEAIRKRATAQRLPLSRALRQAALEVEPRLSERLEELAGLLEWLGQVQEQRAAGVLAALDARLEYSRYLRAHSGFPEVGEGKAASVKAFLDYARDKGSVRELREHLEYLADLQLGHEEEAEAITLMTVFRAKGLEWPLVFLPDCTEGTFPYGGNPNTEEERRLFYVALTRSKGHTHLYVPLSGTPSRFLREAEAQPTLQTVERLGEALFKPAKALSSLETLTLARDLGALGLERYLYRWWPAPPEQARAVAQKVLRLFAAAEREGWLEALGLSPAQREVWEALGPLETPPDPQEFRDLAQFLPRATVVASLENVRPGQKVRHPQFGLGTVVRLEDGVAMVAFGDGLRRLALRYARLEVLGG
ncbi:ATP-dependent helicase [Calidithermus roseus]|uniref:DNA 3'-5' helicase n=1 Tax=Calidithermus roseus TaxID=1644118 RepID=A0A399EJB5_9DEIN|nr:ATP-dependent helicase [Calidithermus roseus]RIH84038.1 ATP-dependent DNA helicase PcrA [Calidithermus roseus]